MSPAPIALFCYNRVDHLKLTIEALARNRLAQESDLHIFSDGPRSESDQSGVSSVRKYLRTIQGFKSVHIIERQQNLGLAASIIGGVTQILQGSDRVIVMEDDLVTSPYFLVYMNEGLQTYANDESVASIHGYMYPIQKSTSETFFIRGADCWGWATWSRAWQHMETDGKKLLNELLERNLQTEFDYNGAQGFTEMLRHQIEGKNNSWAIRWHASAFLKEMLTLYPRQSLVVNIGFDGSGTHCGASSSYDVSLSQVPIDVQRIPLREDKIVRREIEKYFRNYHSPEAMSKLTVGSILSKIKRRASKMLPKLSV